jgi:hypothetical protein
VFALVMEVHRCDFRGALEYLAGYAGIPLPTRNSGTDYKPEIERKRQQRERIERSGEWLAEMERFLRLLCRDKIHECDRTLGKPGPWNEVQWQCARAAFVLRDEFLLPEYTLLGFGAIAERARYVLASPAVRAEMTAAIRWAGGVHADGYWQETLA